MKRIVICFISFFVSVFIYGQSKPGNDYLTRIISIVDKIAPEQTDTWRKFIRISKTHNLEDELIASFIAQEECLCFSIDSLELIIETADQAVLDSMRTVLGQSTKDLEGQILAMVPSFQGIEIDGTVEDLAKKYAKKGWKDYWLNHLGYSEEELNKYGYTLEGLHRQHDGTIVLEGYFRTKPATLMLFPVSIDNNDVAYIALNMDYSETNVKSFVNDYFIPLVKEYSGKYGESSISIESERFNRELSSRYISVHDFEKGEILQVANFAIPSVSLRMQVNKDYRLSITIHYVNGFNISNVMSNQDDDI